MKNFYFENEDSEICYTKEHFIQKMIDDEITEIEVYKAEKEKIKGVFWCHYYSLFGENSYDACGKDCKQYAPRNGKSGCCKHYTSTLFTPIEKVTLKFKT
jgi:hypothetical protein